MNDVPFNIRVTQDLKDLFVKASQIEELNISTWARRTLKKEAIRVTKSDKTACHYKVKKQGIEE